MKLKLTGSHWQWSLLAVAALATGASWWHYTKSVARLDVALENLNECETLAAKVRSAQRAPQRASLETRSLDDLGTAVEKAATEARIARDRVLRIDPQASRRIGKTDYLEQATEVELAGVSVRQLVEFIFGVSGRDDELKILTLRMRTPHGESQPNHEEMWLADVVLTQRIYAPTTARR